MPESRPIVNVNLAALQSGLLVRLQHLLDMLAVSLLGAEAVDETRYEGFSVFFSVSPAGNQRLSRDAAAAEAANWHLRTAFRDAIEATGLFLDEARVVAAVYRAASASTLTVGSFNEIKGPEAARFHRLGLPDKLVALRSEFNISPDLAPQLISINAVRNCLVHRLGIVGDKDVSGDGVLALRWRVLALKAQSADGKQEIDIDSQNPVVDSGWSVVLRAIDRSRDFKRGERIELPYEEIVQTFMTLMLFAIETGEALSLKTPTSKSSPADDPHPKDEA
jgi:hypothetical protein